ncbi:MAG: hypothetical protein AAFV72_13600, partial [Cyanobacteria bacterium J06635_1]
MVQTEVSKLNQRELRKLILSIKASTGQLSLLLAICDERNLQAELIDAYETELRQQGITPYQTEVSKLNQRELRKLILSIKASTGQ